MKILRRKNAGRRRGFTLVELLVIVAIMATLASVALMAMAGATEQARVDRTNAEITKLNALIMERYEGYRVRPLAMRPETLATKYGLDPTSTVVLAKMRYFIVMEQMRMELPERKTDLSHPAVILSRPDNTALRPALWQAMRRKAVSMINAKHGVSSQWNDASQTATYVPSLWSDTYSNAECLYLIISTLRDEETTGLDFFSAKEIGDVDGDGMPEILDGWGEPIRFLRWAPGYSATANPVSNPTSIPNAAPTNRQTGDAVNQHDPFDPMKLFSTNYAIYPLIYSSGPDKRVGINGGDQLDYGAIPFPASPSDSFPNNPYHTVHTSYTAGVAVGACILEGSETTEYWHDNITNHINVAR